MAGKADVSAHQRHFGRKATGGPDRSGNRNLQHREPDIGSILDAEFVTLPADTEIQRVGNPVSDLSALRPGLAIEAARAQTLATSRDGMSLFAGRDGPAAPARKNGNSAPERENRAAFYGFSAVLVVLSFWVSGGHALFNHGGATLAARPDATVMLTDQTWHALPGAGLAVSAVLLNTGTAPAAAKPVDVRIRMADGRHLTFRIGAGGARIAAGSAMPVSARFDLMTTASTVLAAPNSGSGAHALDKAAPGIDTVDLSLAAD
jgi:hypothetical protein